MLRTHRKEPSWCDVQLVIWGARATKGGCKMVSAGIAMRPAWFRAAGEASQEGDECSVFGELKSLGITSFTGV